MKKVLSGVLFIFFILVIAIPRSVLANEKNEKVIASYLPLYESWKAEDLDGESLTDAIIAFANFDSNFRIEIPSYYQYQMQETKRIKEVHKDMNVLLGVGGGGNSQGFSEVAASKELRSLFVEDCIKFIKEYNLDGIDIDWEYPVGPDWYPEEDRNWADKENFTLLLLDLREGLDKLEKETGEKYLITYASNVSPWAVTTLEYEKVFEILDRIHLMGYDFEGAWSPQTGHSSALYKYDGLEYSLTASGAVEMFLNYGAPKEKLVLGIPAYSHDFYGVKNENNGLGQPYEEADLAQFGNDVLEERYIDKNGFKRYWDDKAKMPYLFNGNTFISYEDEESIQYKAEYVEEKNLGGMMTWQYFHDRDADLIKVMDKVLNKNVLEQDLWAINKTYKVGELVSYETKTYRCIAEHTSNISWNPSDANTLWTEVINGQEQDGEWKVGVAYNIKEVVNFKNKKYECIQGHTSVGGWTPEDVSSLWKLIN
ncbi:MAG: glycosyl hydrolase family 18 protein [Sarcina sp.]